MRLVAEPPFVPLDPESQLGYLLVRSAEQVARCWNADLRAHGINPRQFSMLACLAQSPGISQGELARRVMLTPQSLGESLAGLVHEGWIARTEAARGRAAQLRLSAKGRALLKQAYPVVRASNRAGFAALTRAECAVLARILHKLIGA